MVKQGLLLLALMVAAGVPSPSFGQSPVAAPQTHVVEIKSFAFVPLRVVVKLADIVQWKNSDLAPHTATADDGVWGTATLRNEESGDFVAKAPGTFAYHCKFHPSMKGVIVVEQ
ncbi:Amicyanin [subsurface metagenome]|jgi:plastocyanin